MDFSDFAGETDRILLRPYRDSDYDAFADLHGRDDVARYLPWETRDAEASRSYVLHPDFQGQGLATGRRTHPARDARGGSLRPVQQLAMFILSGTT